MRVNDFIREEVQHQGFDLDTRGGQRRVVWMQEAWDFAQQEAEKRARPAIQDILTIGGLVERQKNAFGFRCVGVRVGQRLCPPPALVAGLLDRLLEHGARLTALEFYKAFEEIHPFVDGNGRTGKVLLAWLEQNFDDPEFPPDLWGCGLP